MSVTTIHKKDIVLNREKLEDFMEKYNNIHKLYEKFTFLELYNMVMAKHSYLDIKYKGFMSLLCNRNTWKLLYAYAILDTLELSIGDLFELVDVDVAKKIEQKEEWKKKYEKKYQTI